MATFPSLCPMEGLAGKTALVTGAGRGLGAAFAKGLAENQVAVGILDIDQETASATSNAINEAGGKAVAIVADMSVKTSILDAVAQCSDALGPVDILINNAGFGTTPDTAGLAWHEWPEEAWEAVINCNLKGAFLACQAVAPAMMDRGWGRIINVSSATVWHPLPDGAAYIASKAGLIGLTRSLATGLGDHGVTVNTLVPGLTRTEHMANLYPEEQFEAFAQLRSLPRVEIAEDLVGTVLFLSSNASAFVTGQAFVVDGGHVFD